jgi:hypothetical protein
MSAARAQAAAKTTKEADENTVKRVAEENEQLKIQVHEQEER